ncbi:hypothetical protein C2S51_000304 [Perilla frutescens var. frutescens]|nr:hypothetical protein C2S51_000304 [Perilla frutescens var. frutescens]
MGGDPECLFSIRLYLNGRNESERNSGLLRVCVKNESDKTVELRYEVNLVLKVSLALRGLFVDRMSNEREDYRTVVTLQPGYLYWRAYDSFYQESLKSQRHLKIRVDFFIFSNHNHPYIIFKVGGKRFYADESDITKDFPTLLPYPTAGTDDHHHDVVISDVDPNMFQAVLWYIYQAELHYSDIRATYYSRPSHLKSLDELAIYCESTPSHVINSYFALKMIALADRFHLNRLKRHCQMIILYGRPPLVFQELSSYAFKSIYKYIYRGARNTIGRRLQTAVGFTS